MPRLHAVMLIAIMATLPWSQALAQPARPEDGPARAQGEQARVQAEIPVAKVILFSSGVGYFEHAGSVEGDATARLMFKTEQINDVLKSMVVLDLDGGTVQRVGYASQEPLERALKSFGVDISGAPTLADLLRQLRGAEVVVLAPDRIVGRVVGVETHIKVHGTPPVQVREEVLTLLVPGAGLRQIPLSSITSVRLADEQLEGELNKALSLLVESRDRDRRPVEIVFAGKGRRNVRIGYVVETPIWKTSYRLDMSPEKPFMQGWAIVDNTTDSDWRGVRLSLVSGRPISFVQDLYTPLYVPRPLVVPELYASLQPRVYDEGIADGREARKLAAVAPGAAAPPTPSRGRAPAAEGLARREAADFALADRDDARYGRPAEQQAMQLGGPTVQSLADAARIGELFRYQITEPVTLARRGAAMLPIINQPIAAEKVSIYNQSALAKHPLNGAWLTNDTGLTLMAGPITVLDGGVYAGDARLDNIAPKEKRLLSYAIDLNVTVDPSSSSSSALTAARIVRGTLHLTRKHTFTQHYLIHNKAEADRTLIVEHPFRADRKLVEPAEAAEKTPNVYRFRVPVKAGETGKFTVVEERIDLQTIAILPTNPDALLAYVSGKEIPQAVRDAVARAVKLKQEQAELQGRLNDLQRQVDAIKAGQTRLRENLKTVGADTQLGKRYLARLNEEEDQIEKMEAQIAELRDQVNRKQKELADYLSDLSVD